MGMTAAKPGKRFLKFVRRNISDQMHARLMLLLFGRFLCSFLIFRQKLIQTFHQKPAKQKYHGCPSDQNDIFHIPSPSVQIRKHFCSALYSPNAKIVISPDSTVSGVIDTSVFPECLMPRMLIPNFLRIFSSPMLFPTQPSGTSTSKMACCSDFKDNGDYYSLTGYMWLDGDIFSDGPSQPVRGCMEVRYYGPTGYALVATTIALEGRIRNYFDICNNMLTTLSYTAGWSTAPKARPAYSGDTGDYGTPYYWYDEDGDIWYWNGYANEFIGYGSDGYIDEDSGEYMESNDAGWDYDDEYYDDYDPWSDPGDGWGDYSDDEDGWGDYF